MTVVMDLSWLCNFLTNFEPRKGIRYQQIPAFVVSRSERKTSIDTSGSFLQHAKTIEEKTR